jgi:hypothetical protein
MGEVVLTADAAVREENPLQGLGVVVRVGHRVEGELALGVVVRRKVEEDGGGLEDLEVAAIRVNEGRAG